MMSLKPIHALLPVFLCCLVGCQDTISEIIGDYSKSDIKPVIKLVSEPPLVPEEGNHRIDSKAQINLGQDTENIKPVKPPSNTTASENILCSYMQEDHGWNKWTVQLIKDHGAPNTCKATSYEDSNPSDQIFGKVEMSWDEFEYSFEAMPPEITIRHLKVKGELDNWDSWLQKNQNKLVNPSFEVDFTTDTESDPEIQTYIPADEFLNVSYSINRSPSGRVEAVWLTSAF